ncbi:CU044_2847 family protein [Microbispora maris]|uniref:CU044_2847 family protein n=1 Tax=Microbispora maris TaxID=3144104 RepID=UPI003D15B9B7
MVVRGRPTLPRIVKYQLDDGTTVQFETEPPPGYHPAGSDQTAGQVSAAVEPAVRAAQTVLDKVRHMGPKAIEVKFGIKVSGTANWLVAKAATEGNFEVTLTWEPGTKASHPGEASASARL